MKKFCLECNKVFYPTENNYIGYPFKGGYWDAELGRYNFSESPPTSRIFHSRHCMDSFISQRADILTPIFKQIKERENNHDNRENQT